MLKVFQGGLIIGSTATAATDAHVSCYSYLALLNEHHIQLLKRLAVVIGVAAVAATLTVWRKLYQQPLVLVLC